MSKYSFFLFLLLGAAGFLLRGFQLHRGFEAGTGLAVPGSGMAVAAAAVLILAAALLAVLRPPKAAVQSDAPPKAAHIAAAVLTMLMGLLLLLRAPARLELLLGISAWLTALFFLLPLWRGLGARMHIFCRMENTLFYVAWLTVYFSRHISDPVIQAFWPPLTALCATALAFYFLASAACGLPKPRRSLFFLHAGGALCLLAAADFCTAAGAPYALGLLAAAAFQLLYSRRGIALSK